MTTTRRDLLTGAITIAGAAVVPNVTGGQEHQDHDHDHQAVPSDPALRAKALESLMVAKGLVDPAALDALIDNYEHKVGPRNGARVVARAWIDPEYKKRLLRDANAAIAELGYGGDTMLVVENSAKVHNLVVCTLCSCYPWSTLGLPPVWYKSAAYRCAVGDRSTGRIARVWTELGRRSRSAGLGQHGGVAVPGASGTAGWHRAHERSGIGGARDARRDGGRREGGTAPRS